MTEDTDIVAEAEAILDPLGLSQAGAQIRAHKESGEYTQEQQDKDAQMVLHVAVLKGSAKTLTSYRQNMISKMDQLLKLQEIIAGMPAPQIVRDTFEDIKLLLNDDTVEKSLHADAAAILSGRTAQELAQEAKAKIETSAKAEAALEKLIKAMGEAKNRENPYGL